MRIGFNAGKPAVRRATLLAFAALALTAATVAPTGAESIPPDGTVTRTLDLPDNFAKFDPVADSTVHAGEPSAQTILLADPNAHLLLEVSTVDPGVNFPQARDCTVYTPPAAYQGLGYSQVEWAEYDSRTYERKAAVCGLPALAALETLNATSNVGSTGVVDSTDHVLFAPCMCGNGIDTAMRSVIAVREQPLEIAGDFCVQNLPDNQCTLPQTTSSSQAAVSGLLGEPYHYIQGISWYAPTDDLLVLTDHMASHSSASVNQNFGEDQPDLATGVAVTDYHISHPNGVLTLTLEWTVHLPPSICHRSLTTPLGMTAAAYRSENPADPAVFIPCTAQLLQAGGGATTNPTTTVVKVPLQADGQPAGDPLLDPTVKIEAPVAPVNSEDFLFDPQSERGYLLPSAPSGNGLTLALYDGGGAGRSSGFISRIRVGTYAYDSYGFDLTTGRLYVEDALYDGLMLVDGRLRQGQGYAAYPFPQFATHHDVATWNIATLPPDDAHPFTRVFIPNVTNVDESTHGVVTGQEHMAAITVVADRVPVSTDAPRAAVDSNTYTGVIPHNADVSSTYSSRAAGYGLHSVNVGGYSGAVQNNVDLGIFSGSIPFGSATSDVAVGAVPETKLSDGLAQANATALSDVNGNASQAYRACSNLLSVRGCAPPPPPCPLGSDIDPCSQVLGGSPAQACPTAGPTGNTCTQLRNTTTAQEWPYATVECSDPGPSDLQGRHEADGATYTPARQIGTPPSPQPAPVDDGATAVADCSNGSAVGIGRFGCSSVTPPDGSTRGLPDTRCGSAENPFVIGSSRLGLQISVGSAWTQTSASPPVKGLATTSVRAVVQDIRIDLGGGTSLDIAQIEQVVWAEAGGTPGSARTSRRVYLQGITLSQPNEPDTHLCFQPCSGDQVLLDRINALDPSQVYAILPQPDEPFGTEVDGISPRGSPGGYQAQVWASQAEQQGDTQFNSMNGWGGTENEMLPALRLILNNPGGTTVSREVLDFAGVEADASLGLQVNAFSSDNTNTVELTQAMTAAGVAPSGNYVPGTLGSLPGPSPAAGGTYPPGLLGVLERALAGVGWLVRSPMAGLQMAAFLVLLGLPVALIRRRWVWQSDD